MPCRYHNPADGNCPQCAMEDARRPMTYDEAKERASKLTFDRDLVNEIVGLIMGCVWTERNECARVAKDNDAPRIERLILERNRTAQ